MPSFFCERTAEYALVSLLQRSLQSHFGSCVPIFYWKTREGNKVSEALHEGRLIKVLAMFARRPKTTDRKEVRGGKINQEVAEFAAIARVAGIPVIAGFPAVEFTLDLYSDPTIFWLPLDASRDAELRFTVDLSKPRLALIEDGGQPMRTMSLSEVARDIEKNAKVFQWDEAMQCIAELRQSHGGPEAYSPFAWFGGYKPVYFLMPQDVGCP